MLLLEVRVASDVAIPALAALRRNRPPTSTGSSADGERRLILILRLNPSLSSHHQKRRIR